MQILRRFKVRDQATEQIKQYIVERKLLPGDRLPTVLSVTTFSTFVREFSPLSP